MKNKFFNVIISIIIISILATLASTGYILYEDYQKGRVEAQTRFEKLVAKCEEAIMVYKQPTRLFLLIPQNELKMYPYSYHTLSIDYFGQNVLTYPSVQNTRFKGFYTTYSDSIVESNNINLTITAQLYTLPSSIIYLRIRVTFIIILSITFLCALLLIATCLDSSDKKSKAVVKKDEYKAENNEIKDDDELVLTEDEDYTEESYEESDETEVQETQEEKPAYEPVSLNTEPVEKPDVSYGETVTSQINTPLGAAPAAEEKIPTPAEVLKSTPEDHDQMFSTATGFCFEKHLVSRLESELARAASSQIDISLVLVKIPGLVLDSPCGIEICKKILDIFHYRDMLFEYKTDGIAIIFSNANIDKAMESCESIYAEICSILSRNNSSTKPYIGIASRSLRFISGERIITEAEQALIHAGEDQDSPIIAFRVNPEKYRKYMATKE
ncbi:hypothetical protein [Treponema sp.]|uniref:hypothetical protein n=1 Tax=Treponema sp. TaxID=166 RepID=UPI00388E7B55